MLRASCALSAGCKSEARAGPTLAANRTIADIRGIPTQKYEREPIHSHIAHVLGQRKRQGLSRGCGAAPRKPRGGGCGSVVARHGINGKRNRGSKPPLVAKPPLCAARAATTTARDHEHLEERIGLEGQQERNPQILVHDDLPTTPLVFVGREYGR